MLSGYRVLSSWLGEGARCAKQENEEDGRFIFSQHDSYFLISLLWLVTQEVIHAGVGNALVEDQACQFFECLAAQMNIAECAAPGVEVRLVVHVRAQVDVQQVDVGVLRRDRGHRLVHDSPQGDPESFDYDAEPEFEDWVDERWGDQDQDGEA